MNATLIDENSSVLQISSFQKYFSNVFKNGITLSFFRIIVIKFTKLQVRPIDNLKLCYHPILVYEANDI